MKKITKFIIIGILTIMNLGLFTGCGTGTDYFTYRILKLEDEEPQVIITGLTEKGQQQKILIIPEKIKGNRVSGLDVGWEENDVLEKLYFESTGRFIWGCRETFESFTKLEKVIVMNPNYYYGSTSNHIANYVSHAIYEGKKNLADFTFPANVSYYYNYDTTEVYHSWYEDRILGYHWIDDVEYGEKIEFIPSVPTRDGYKFGGWHKEPECINVWDFKSDTLPQKQTDTDGKTIYQETALYAKWIKK